MSDTYINRDDIRRYVHDTMPWVKTSERVIAAIAEDIIDVWPSLIGDHPDLVDAEGHDHGMQWLDAHIDADMYWAIVARHRESDSKTRNYYRTTAASLP